MSIYYYCFTLGGGGGGGAHTNENLDRDAHVLYLNLKLAIRYIFRLLEIRVFFGFVKNISLLFGLENLDYFFGYQNKLCSIEFIEV